jgi:hypothetical protein
MAIRHSDNITKIFKDNSTRIFKDDNTSSENCEVFVIETKLTGSDIGFAAIAAVCIVAGFVLVFAGMK